jgi:hypothetical protein
MKLLELKIGPQPAETKVARVPEECRAKNRPGFFISIEPAQAFGKTADTMSITRGQLNSSAQST